MLRYKYAFKTREMFIYDIDNYLTEFEWIEYKCVGGLECAIIAHDPMKFIPLSHKLLNI